MSKRIVSYTVGEDGEIMRVLPSGKVSFSDSFMDTLRDMREHERAGYEVLIDGEPLVPQKGFIAWLSRMIDKLPGGKRP